VVEDLPVLEENVWNTMLIAGTITYFPNSCVSVSIYLMLFKTNGFAAYFSQDHCPQLRLLQMSEAFRYHRLTQDSTLWTHPVIQGIIQANLTSPHLTSPHLISHHLTSWTADIGSQHKRSLHEAALAPTHHHSTAYPKPSQPRDIHLSIHCTHPRRNCHQTGVFFASPQLCSLFTPRCVSRALFNIFLA
jgi:hypothetical protein